jgi:hypothetical protein
MRKLVVRILETAEEITPEKVFNVLMFAFRGDVLAVQEICCFCGDEILMGEEDTVEGKACHHNCLDGSYE